MVDIRKQHRHVRVPTNYPSHRDKQASLSLFLGEIVNDGHTALVKHLAFSPKGDYLATCGYVLLAHGRIYLTSSCGETGGTETLLFLQSAITAITLEHSMSSTILQPMPR